MWDYPDVVDGTCEASMLLATELIKLLNIKISMGSIKCHKGIRVVWKWSDIYRTQGEYIST
jgi:hypothetical protein